MLQKDSCLKLYTYHSSMIYCKSWQVLRVVSSAGVSPSWQWSVGV